MTTDPRNARSGSWSYFNPVRVHAAPGLLDALDSFAPAGSVLLLTSSGFTRRGVAERLERALGDRVTVCDEVTPNPDLDDLDALAARLRPARIEGIVALGGGSVIDSAKALSLTLPAGSERPLDEALRGGDEPEWDSHLPVVACPTTAGTGAEVTPFATIWDSREGRKLSLAHEALYPQAALLDPTVTLTLPKDETLHSGLDAVSHALESLWNRNRTGISASHATRALSLAVEALPVVLATPDSVEDRAQMQEAALLAGLAISQTKTALAHSVSYPLTSHLGIPHGLAAGFLLPDILAMVLDEGIDLGLSEPLLAATRDMLETFGLPDRLMGYASKSQIMALSPQMYTPDRAENFPLPMGPDVLAGLLERLPDD